MRLWIDGQCLQTASRLRGIGRYVTELVRALADYHPEVELSISFNASMPDDALLAREAICDLIEPRNTHVWHGAARGGEAVEGYTSERQLSELSIAHHVNCLAPDVALSASPFEGVGDMAVPLLPSRGCRVPTASIFYDAIPYRYKDMYLQGTKMSDYYHRRLNAHRGFADNLCISEFSKSEIKSIHAAAIAENISAGISKDFVEIEKKEQYGQRWDLGDFVLYIGALDWRKNVKVIVEAFRHIDQIWPKNELRLVMAGDAPVELLSDVVSAWNGLGLERDRLIWLGHVSDVELVSLYRQARVLVQPSFMEGFGLTALEAIHCGTPVVAARAGALPEVVTTDELLFDPFSPEALAEAIARLLRDKSGTEQLMNKVKAHAAQFTWARSASIAVERLAKLASRDVRRDIAASRQQIIRMMDFRSLDRDVAARSLALSEPTPLQSRLLVDTTSTVLMDHKTGIQRVVKKICGAIAESGSPRRDIEKRFLFCDDDSGWFSVDGSALDPVRKQDKSHIVLAGDLLLMLDSSWHLFDLHKPHLRACRLRGGEVISCLYDTVPLFAQAMCNPAVPPVFAEWFKTALTYSTGFVCISRTVADELLTLLKAIEFPRRMKVGYWQLGADFIGEASTNQHLKVAVPRRPLFLMVGTVEPRKGHRVVLDAFEALWLDGVDADLMIVGKKGWGVAHLIGRIRAHPEFGKRLAWREKVSDEELGSLYAQCDALIAASFAEGFGLPIVEAGHFGKPVLASDIPVFREVGKGAAAANFFKVGDSTALATVVRKFMKARRKANAQSRMEWPSWAESAAQLEEVVVGKNWYETYEPRERRPFAPLTDFGRTRMTGPIEDTDRAHRLELVEGPFLSDDGSAHKIVVALTNLSQTVWSSLGTIGGGFGIALSYHLIDHAGRDLQFENPRTHIPFVLVPGDTIYMAVNVPVEWKTRGAAFVDIEVVQEGVAWFGSLLQVSL